MVRPGTAAASAVRSSLALDTVTLGPLARAADPVAPPDGVACGPGVSVAGAAWSPGSPRTDCGPLGAGYAGNSTCSVPYGLTLSGQLSRSLPATRSCRSAPTRPAEALHVSWSRSSDGLRRTASRA